MTKLEGLVSICQTALQVRGEWCVNGINETLRRDISAIVHDIGRLLRLDGHEYTMLTRRAIDELESRAIGAEEPPPPVDDGSCDPLYGQRMDSADMGEC